MCSYKDVEIIPLHFVQILHFHEPIHKACFSKSEVNLKCIQRTKQLLNIQLLGFESLLKTVKPVVANADN